MDNFPKNIRICIDLSTSRGIINGVIYRGVIDVKMNRAIRKAMQFRGVSLYEMSWLLWGTEETEQGNVRGCGAVSARLSRKNPTVNSVLRMLDPLEFELIIRAKDNALFEIAVNNIDDEGVNDVDGHTETESADIAGN